MKVGQTSRAYDCSMEAWRLSMSLMAGLKGLLTYNQEYLPQHERESSAGYNRRIKTANLYNVFRRSVRSLSSKPFAKPVNVVKVPPELENLDGDVDRDGQTLTQLSRELTSAILTFGLTHALVDNPSYDAEKITRKDALDMNIHPYFIHVKPDSLIYWSYVRGLTGESILDEIHIRSEEIDDDNVEWSRITVWTRDEVKHYKKRKDAAKTEVEYTLDYDTPNHLGKIPLVTIYADVAKKGLMLADCPLEDLAELNLRHFRSQSDQDACLHFARVPFLHFAGFQADEVQKTLAVNNTFISSNHQSSVKWVETEGKSMEMGMKDLDALETRMESMGADMLVQKPGNETATAKAIDTSDKISDLQAIAMALEDGLHQMYMIAAEWLDIKNPEIEIEVFKLFGISLKDKNELDTLLKARIAGEITRETWLNELKRRGILDDGFDVTKELNTLSLEDDKEAEREAGAVA